MTLYINLYGGPGTGKSTGMAYVFSRLKMLGYCAEQVPEYAKELAWEAQAAGLDFHPGLANQLSVFAQQDHRQWRLKGQTKVAITDSPLLLNLVYGGEQVTNEFKDKVLSRIDYYQNSHFFLTREKDYNPKGRFQTKEEAEALDSRIKQALTDNDLPYKEVPANEDGYQVIVNEVLRVLHGQPIHGIYGCPGA